MSRQPSTTPPADAEMPTRHPKAPAVGSQIPSHFGYCFGCGELHKSGLHFKAIAGANLDLTGSFTVTEDHQGAPGLAHGGLLSLAFDEAMGKLMWLIRTPAVTGRLETDFLQPVPMGRTLFIDARITGRAGRKIYVSAEGKLDSVDGEIAVKAAAIFIEVPMQHFISNLTAEYKDHLKKHPDLMAFVDPEFDIKSMSQVKVLIKRLDPSVPMPKYAKGGDAGADLTTTIDFTIAPGQRMLIPTGISIALPNGYAAFVHPRSGLAIKNGISMVNTPGTVDAGYRGELQVILINHDLTDSLSFKKGDRIAQLVIQRVEVADFIEVAQLPGSERASGGFGSTGS